MSPGGCCQPPSKASAPFVWRKRWYSVLDVRKYHAPPPHQRSTQQAGNYADLAFNCASSHASNRFRSGDISKKDLKGDLWIPMYSHAGKRGVEMYGKHVYSCVLDVTCSGCYYPRSS